MTIVLYVGCAFVIWAVLYGLFFTEVEKYSGARLIDLCLDLFRR